MERDDEKRPEETVEADAGESALSKAAAMGPLPGIHDDEAAEES